MTDAERALLLLVARYITDGTHPDMLRTGHADAIKKDIATARTVVLMDTVEKLKKTESVYCRHGLLPGNCRICHA